MLELLLILVVIAALGGGFFWNPLAFLLLIAVLIAIFRPGGFRTRW